MSFRRPARAPWDVIDVPMARPQRKETPVRVHGYLLVATAFTMWIAHGAGYAAAMLAFLICHEGGHYLACRAYGVSASLPYFLPAPPMIFLPGTLGAVIRVHDPFPNRNALFDMGASGPWGGFVVALPVLAVGLALSTISTEPLDSMYFVFGDSLVTVAVERLVVGDLPAGTYLVQHPLAFAGWFGMLVTSLNLLPVGQLDGGHVAYALGIRSRIFPIFLVSILVWLAWYSWSGWAFWAGILLIMIALGHPPTMADHVPLSPGRRVGAFLSLILLMITFVPNPITLVP